MSEPFNFTRHFNELVRPVLIERGFSSKGMKFLRARDGYNDLIWIMRSRWNEPAAGQCRFTVDLGLISDGFEWFGSFDRPTEMKLPKGYKHPWFEQGKIDEGLEPPDPLKSIWWWQRGAIDRLDDELQWSYANESELVAQLRLLAKTLADHTDRIFSLLSRVDPKSNDSLREEGGRILYEYYDEMVPAQTRHRTA